MSYYLSDIFMFRYWGSKCKEMKTTSQLFIYCIKWFFHGSTLILYNINYSLSLITEIKSDIVDGKTIKLAVA